MSNINLVVFDMAGTTVQDDDEVQRCFLDAATQVGLQASRERVNAMMGLAKKQVLQTLWAEQIGIDHPDYKTQVETSYETFKQILEHHYHTEPVGCTPGCVEIFNWLKSQDIKIALTTGFYREVTNIILDRLGWSQGLDHHYLGSSDSIIQASITPSEIYNNEGRPAPFMIQKAMYYLKVTDPKTVIKVGDTPSDLAAGINANCLLSLGITSGTHTRSQLEQYPSHGLIDSLDALKEIILRGSL